MNELRDELSGKGRFTYSPVYGSKFCAICKSSAHLDEIICAVCKYQRIQKRGEIAREVLTGFLAGMPLPADEVSEKDKFEMRNVALFCYAMADAMIEVGDES